MFIFLGRLQENPFPKRLRTFLIVTAVFIGCMANYEATAGVKARGVRYKDIDFNLLVTTYKDAYQKAGFEVTPLDDNKIPTRWRMSFLPPNHSKIQKLSIDISIYEHTFIWDISDLTPLPSNDKAHTNSCQLCTVFIEVPETYLGEIDQQLRQADAKATEKIDQQLHSYSWKAPHGWGNSGIPNISLVYIHIGVVDLISTYKQAYAEFGFELENINVDVNKESLQEQRRIEFKLTNHKQHKFKGYSTLIMYSSRSYWCDACAVDTDFRSNVSAENHDEVETKDRLARNLADFKLAKFRYQPNYTSLR